jgi:Fe-coproporphyrin III synthase
MPSLTQIAKRRLNLLTDRLYTVPMIVLMPHSRCNARCLMCDIWKANENKTELSREQLLPHVDALRELGVQRIVFSGGEALMHSNLFALCELLREIGARLTLLSTGLTLEHHASDVARWFDEVTLSLDGPPAVHDAIRNIPRAYEKLSRGARAAKSAGVPRITGRSVVQRRNFRFLEETIDAAREAGLDQLSFLPVDVSSEAFNRPGGWTGDRVSETALSLDEAFELRDRIEDLLARRGSDIFSGFVAERPSKLRALAQYFLAHHDVTPHPDTVCNAPWVSAVVEADGTVRPCFFHRPLGNLHTHSLTEVLNGADALQFRRDLDVTRDPICRRCVCTLSIGPRSEL